MKQTAVEFLVDNFHYYYSTKWNDIVEQAKEMESKHIENAYEDGRICKKTIDIKLGKEYYKATFKIKNK